MTKGTCTRGLLHLKAPRSVIVPFIQQQGCCVCLPPRYLVTGVAIVWSTTPFAVLRWFLPRDATLARYMPSSCVRPSVCPSQASIAPKRLDESVGIWHGGFLPLIPHCVIRKFGVCRIIRVLPSGTLGQTSDLENFAAAICVVDKLSSSSTVEFVDENDNRRVVAVY